ncbi:hypothetical protein BDW02DRAFT_530817, partial [Decorospora gaudefroyi]
MNFPPKVRRTGWAPFETVYLELFHDKIKQAAASDPNIQMPRIKKIVDAFNAFFETRADIQDKNGNLLDPLARRNLSALASYMNRRGGKLRTTRDSLAHLPTSNGNNAYMPTITDEEIRAYLLTENASGTGPNLPQPSGGTLTGKGKQPSKPNETPVLPTDPGIVAMLKEEGWEIPDLPRNSNEALLRYQESNKNRPLDTTFIIQAQEALETRLKRNPIPVTGYYGRCGQRAQWYKDRKQEKEEEAVEAGKEDEEKEEEVEEEKDDKLELRNPSAAAVSGLLGAAIIPPYGYRGDIRDLVGKSLLAQNELILHETSEAAMTSIHEEHDKNFEKRREDI